MEQIVLDFKKIDMCSELTTTQRILIKKIHLLSKNEGFCYASNKGLANMMAMSASGIAKVVTRLVELGFINRVITKENGNERHITLTKKCIEMFKKCVESTKNVGNNIKPKKDNKKQQPKPNEQKIINVSDEVKTILKDKLNLTADETIEKLEQDKGSNEVIACINHVYANIVAKKGEAIGSTNYLVTVFENGFTSKSILSKACRIEMVPDWLEAQSKNGDGWDEVHRKKSNEIQTSIHEMLGGSFGMPIWETK